MDRNEKLPLFKALCKTRNCKFPVKWCTVINSPEVRDLQVTSVYPASAEFKVTVNDPVVEKVWAFPMLYGPDNRKKLTLPPEWKQRLTRDPDVFGMSGLPPPPVFEKDTVSMCYLVRFRNPWDFHVILECFRDYNFDPKQNNLPFESTLEVFRGITAALSHHMDNLKWDKDYTYEKDDLVICAVQREIPGGKAWFGYRGVVLEYDVKLLEQEQVDDEKEKILVYLLDIGEVRVIEKHKGFMMRLPEEFVKIPPLAVHCGLHGVSAVGAEWNESAIQIMRKLVGNPEEYGTGNKMMYVQWMGQKEPINKDSGTWSMTGWELEINVVELWCLDEKPTSEELVEEAAKDGSLEEGSANVTEELIKNEVGLEWNSWSDKPSLTEEMWRKKERQETKQERSERIARKSEREEDEVNVRYWNRGLKSEEREKGMLQTDWRMKEEDHRGKLLLMSGGGREAPCQKKALGALEEDIMNAWVPNQQRLNAEVLEFDTRSQEVDNVMAIRIPVEQATGRTSAEEMEKKDKAKKPEMKNFAPGAGRGRGRGRGKKL